jgi:hypothetical protein
MQKHEGVHACLNWMRHLELSNIVFENAKLLNFLRAKVLHWMEALSWMSIVSPGILLITSLENIASVNFSNSAFSPSLANSTYRKPTMPKPLSKPLSWFMTWSDLHSPRDQF